MRKGSVVISAAVVALSFAVFRFCCKRLEILTPYRIGVLLNTTLEKILAVILVLLAATALFFAVMRTIEKRSDKLLSSRFWACFFAVLLAVFCVFAVSLNKRTNVYWNMSRIDTAAASPLSLPAKMYNAMIPRVFALEYLKGKKVVSLVPEDDPMVSSLAADFISADRISFDEGRVIDASWRYYLRLLDYYPALDSVWITDGSWENDETIMLVRDDVGLCYFIPSSVYEHAAATVSADETASPAVFAAASGSAIPSDFLKSVFARYGGHAVHLALLLVLYFFGAAILFVARASSKLLTPFLAFPVGIVVFALEIQLMCLLGIDFTVASTASCFLLTLLACCIIIVKRKTPFRDLIPVAIGLAAFAVLAYIAVSRDSYNLSYDSTYIIFLGNKLATFGSMSGSWTDFVAYGNLSPILCGLGYLYGAGVPYAVFPLFYCLIVICSGVFCFKLLANSGKPHIFRILASCVPPIALLLYAEAHYHMHWVLNNLLVCFYCLAACVGFVLMKKRSEAFGSFVVSVSLIAFSATRTEGAVFAALLIIAATLLDIDRRKLSLCSLSVLVWCALYNGLIFLRAEESSIFWNPRTAIISCVALAAASAVCFALYRFPALNKLTPHLFWIYFGALAVMAAGSCILSVEGAARTDLRILLLHLTSNEWMPVTMLAVILLISAAAMKTENVKYIVFCVVGYFVLLWCIVMFRMVNGEFLPLHEEYGDSGRRILFQIAPAVITLLWADTANALGKLKKEDHK